MSDTHHTGSPNPHGPDGAQEHGVRYERDDVQAGPVIWFVVGLTVMTALIFFGMMWMMNSFNDSESKAKKTTWEAPGKEQDGKEVEMSVGPIAGDAGRNRFRGIPGSDGPARNHGTIGNTPRLEGIDIHNPQDPNFLSEHTLGRHLPGDVKTAPREQIDREENYLKSWSPFSADGAPGHVPIAVAMKHLAKGTGPLPPDEWQEAPGRSSSGRVARVPGPNSATLGHDPGTKEAPKAPPVEDPKK